MKILGIETSSPVFSIVLADNDRTVFEIRKDRRASGSNRDAGLFDDLRNMAGHHECRQAQAIAISIGPGLFTSLRVGLSLAKALAIAWSKPVVAVNTLDMLGISSAVIAGPVLALIDAHHNELYAARYESGKLIGGYRLTTPQELVAMISGKVTAVGSGVHRLEKYVNEWITVDHAASESFRPDAARLIEIARPRAERQQYEDIEYLEPFYLKRTDAERNRNKTDEI